MRYLILAVVAATLECSAVRAEYDPERPECPPYSVEYPSEEVEGDEDWFSLCCRFADENGINYEDLECCPYNDCPDHNHCDEAGAPSGCCGEVCVHDPDDDLSPTSPCDPEGNGGGDGTDCDKSNPHPDGCPETSTGPGLHLDFTTGSITTRIPIFSSYAAARPDLAMELTYSSYRVRPALYESLPGVQTNLPRGWQHSFGQHIRLVTQTIVDRHPCYCSSQATFCVDEGQYHDNCESCSAFDCWCVGSHACHCEEDENCPEVCHFCPPPVSRVVLHKVIYTDETGRNHSFRNPYGWGTGLISPPGRNMRILVHNFSDAEHYRIEIQRPDQTSVVFNTVSSEDYSIVDRRGRTTRVWRGTSEIVVESGYGRQAILELNSNGYISEVIAPDGTSTSLSYVGDALVAVADADSKAISFDYDPPVGPPCEPGNPGEFPNCQPAAVDYYLAKETLRNGTTYFARYDFLDHVRTLKDANSNAIAQVSCTNGFPGYRDEAILAGTVVYTDGNGEPWLYHRDSHGWITEKEDPEGGHQYFEYGTAGDDLGRLVSVTDELGRETTFTYNFRGRILSRTDADGNVYTYNYLSEGDWIGYDVTTAGLPGDRQWEYTYFSNGDLHEVSDPINGNTSGIEYEYEDWPNNENLGSSGLALNGRPHTVTRTDHLGHQTVKEYDTRGNLTTITRSYGELDIITEFEHDAMGRVTKRTLHREDADIVDSRTYDIHGRITAETIDSSGLALVTSNGYDARGNLKSVRDPEDNLWTFEYDLRNRLVKRTQAAGDLNLVTTWGLDGNSNVVHLVDANENATTFIYNLRNELTEIDDAGGYKTELDYDPAGNLTQIDRWLEGMTGPAGFLPCLTTMI